MALPDTIIRSVTSRLHGHLNRIYNEVFIENIRDRPAIWDNRSTDYMNKEKKYRMWKEVASATHPPFPLLDKPQRDKCLFDMFRRWRGIMNSFTRELNYMKNHKCGPRKSFVHFELLQFLKPAIKDSLSGDLDQYFLSTIVSNQLGSQKIENLIIEDHQHGSDQPQIDQSTNSAVEEHGTTDSSSVQPMLTTTPSEEIQVATGQSVLPECINNSASEVQQILPDNVEASDSDKYFLLSLLNDLRRVPEDSKLQCKIAIKTSMLQFVPSKPTESS